MKKIDDLLIIGGDCRQPYIAARLREKGYGATLYGTAISGNVTRVELKSAAASADALVFPAPLTKDGKRVFSIEPMDETPDEILSLVKPGQPVFGGMLDKTTETKIKNAGGRPFDYLKRGETLEMNAVPTVQGIFKAIVDNVDYTIHSSVCAVFGYGRIGSLTADLLLSAGACVTVCVRKYSDAAKARVKGCESVFIKDFYKTARKFDIIINTVPALVIDEKVLKNVGSGVLILDVASAPYGTDFAAARELGIKVLQLSSLPGRAAPKTAGKIIADGIMNILREEDYG